MRRYSRRSLGAVKNQCEQYEVVKNTDGQVVGQIIGAAPAPVQTAVPLHILN